MENYTNRLITEERNNMGMVRYCVVDRTNTPNAFCGGSFNTKKQGIEQLKRAKHLYPNHKWTLEAIFSIGGKEKKRKNLGDPLVRLTESDLHRIIKESVSKVLNEESYRKAAQKGEHTSSALKHELNYQKKMGSYKPKDYHKFANKNGLNKMDVNTICDFEDARDAEKICESSINEGLSFKMKVWEIINDALYNAFGDDFGCGNGWDVTNPDNKDEYVHITFGG